VAIQSKPEILLLDELMSAGDEAFKVKSTASMYELLDRAGTIVVVSHGLTRLQRFCSRFAWMVDGRVAAVGDPEEIARRYRRHIGVESDDDDDD
jgi:ABC-type polysaccharide/polyol phosphate transport system ATPase subunit